MVHKPEQLFQVKGSKKENVNSGMVAYERFQCAERSYSCTASLDSRPHGDKKPKVKPRNVDNVFSYRRICHLNHLSDCMSFDMFLPSRTRLIVCLPICLSVRLLVFLPACQSMYVWKSVYPPSACLSACLSVYPFVCLSVCLLACLSLRQSAYSLRACLSVRPSVCSL